MVPILQIGRNLMLVGAIIFIVGGIIYALGRYGIPIGRLPGDIRIQGNTFTCVLAIGTSIVLSIILTIILNLGSRFLSR